MHVARDYLDLKSNCLDDFLGVNVYSFNLSSEPLDKICFIFGLNDILVPGQGQ